MLRNIIPCIVSGPSGCGKTTIVTQLIQKYPNQYQQTISYTTRKARAGEVHGVHYYYIDQLKFEDMVEKEEFVQHEKNFTNYYATSKQEVLRINKSGKIPIFVIDVKGAIQIAGSNFFNKINYILIKPPSFEELRVRLISRNSESEQDLKKRISSAQQQLQLAFDSKLYQQRNDIVNDQLDQSVEQLTNLMNSLYKDVPPHNTY